MPPGQEAGGDAIEHVGDGRELDRLQDEAGREGIGIGRLDGEDAEEQPGGNHGEGGEQARRGGEREHLGRRACGGRVGHPDLIEDEPPEQEDAHGQAVEAGERQEREGHGEREVADAQRMVEGAEQAHEQPAEHVVARHHRVLVANVVREEQQHLEVAREGRAADQEDGGGGGGGDGRDLDALGRLDEPRPHVQVPEPQRRMALVGAIPGDEVPEAVCQPGQGPGVDLVAPHLVVNVHPDEEGQVGHAQAERESPTGLAVLGERLERAAHGHWPKTEMRLRWKQLVPG